MSKIECETQLLESKLAERRRELVPLDAVRRHWEAAFVALRSVVLGFDALREADRHALLEELSAEPLVAAAIVFNEPPPTPDDDEPSASQPTLT